MVTDGHDQLDRPIDELLKTLSAYGQPHLSLFETDNASHDKPYFLRKFASLAAKQAELDQGSSDPTDAQLAPAAQLEDADFSLLVNAASSNSAISSMRSLVCGREGGRAASRRLGRGVGYHQKR